MGDACSVQVLDANLYRALVVSPKGKNALSTEKG
jgi:hypothetical protein